MKKSQEYFYQRKATKSSYFSLCMYIQRYYILEINSHKLVGSIDIKTT